MALKYFLAAATAFTAWTAHAEMFFQPDNSPPHFCMQNFNAYGPIYASRIEERTEWMTAELQAKPRCDVVHLQEVWNKSQIDVVDNSLRGLYSISAPNRQEKIGVMSLFMGDIKSTETHDFKVNSDGNILDRARGVFNVKKAWHVATVHLPNVDESFYFMNTHLHPTSPAVRLTQILELVDWRLQHQDLKLLLSGDFNGDEVSLERAVIMSLMGVHDSLLETLGGTYPKGLCTYCASNPLSWLSSDHVLDYIFFSNISEASTKLKPLDGDINLRGTPRKPLSDHFGLRVDFSVEPGQVSADAPTIEGRRNYALQLLARMETVLGKEKSQDFAPALKKARMLRDQLEKRSGAFNDYFEKFN